MPIPGHTITIHRSTDGGAYASLVTGWDVDTPYVDEIATAQHDPTAGTRTERVYRVRLIRTSDSAIVGERTTSPVVTYDDAC